MFHKGNANSGDDPVPLFPFGIGVYKVDLHPSHFVADPAQEHNLIHIDVGNAERFCRCGTPPGLPSASGDCTVWMESTINRPGRTASMCPSTEDRSLSAAR